MHPGALALLRCPRCGAGLEEHDLPTHALRCATGHAFDVARQGHVGLLEGAPARHEEDTPAMVAAREAFLAAGHFAPLSDALADAVVAATDGAPGGLVDVGAGTGHHTAIVLDALAPSRAGVALDLSRPALQRAARAHPRLGAARADAWGGLPVGDGVAAAVLCVFAPRAPDELRRVLAPGGALVVATPRPDHLAELRAPLGLLAVDPRKDERLSRQLAAVGEVVDERVVRHELVLSRADAGHLAAMGPAARHVAPDELARRLGALGDATHATLAVAVTTVRRTV